MAVPKIEFDALHISKAAACSAHDAADIPLLTSPTVGTQDGAFEERKMDRANDGKRPAFGRVIRIETVDLGRQCYTRESG